MKKLIFDYRTTLNFSTPVSDHRFQLRCVPCTGPRQQIVDVTVRTEPHTTLDSTVDSFGSVVMTGFVAEPHTESIVEVKGIAFVDNAHIAPEPFKPLYLYQSELTQLGPSLDALVALVRTKLEEADCGSDPIAQAQVIMHAVYDAFVYTPGSTNVRTTSEEALRQRAGVCQDYAHVMLSVCRALEIPARYIAGLLSGEGATHAWVEVYDHGRWIGLDPTHDRMVDDNYITIAHGRDYRDCMLDIGLFRGGDVTQTQTVNASVHEWQ
ncbi:transglutaminase family protein [Bifidobacterium gallicum]|uniref:Transglutaminase n=1 Tax=Bifidobacterium gallicum DSM 20093 = LMG 11596 TaxID=561180 RepID=D1NVA7_9BIFI|nr:transglutaminase family protein [Bifidobacterium gallicum]EFA22758.1 transglutaminase-like protein [Bifidobacterium gallicum DSM 20093 = LMG 11596]KFI59701.1 transglutaminase [Bifidobacterium gallicum DSM 20093 = LMG 11596]